jgi:hypothetical protein
MQSFKQWMIDNYTPEELQDIARQGCISGAASGLIYYRETVAAYDKYGEELHDVISDYRENYGEYPPYVVDALSSIDGFKNAVVWFVAEVYAQELTETEVNND